jgi:hypothetical protein
MEEHEEYPGSLMGMESYDLETHELPSTSIFETVEHSHMHGDSRARDNFEDTSICVSRVVDLHVEVDLVVHPGSMMQHEYTKDDMSMQEHTMVSDSSQRHTEMHGGIQRSVLACREETHLVEHGDVSPLQQHIVLRDHLRSISSRMRDERWRVIDSTVGGVTSRLYLDDWGSMMTTCEYLSWVPIDKLLVESLRLTRAW